MPDGGARYTYLTGIAKLSNLISAEDERKSEADHYSTLLVEMKKSIAYHYAAWWQCKDISAWALTLLFDVSKTCHKRSFERLRHYGHHCP